MGIDAADDGFSSRSGTILLIEDNPAYLRLVRELLTEAGLDGFEVEWADTLEAGVDRLREGRVDLVLLDLLLPDNLGTDTLEVALDQAEGAPIVVLTGIQDDQLAREALDLGADDYLCKGRLDPERLARSVQGALAGDDPSPGVEHRDVRAHRLVGPVADRLEGAVDALDEALDRRDPLAGEMGTPLAEERDRCRRIAEGLRELERALEDDPQLEPVPLDALLDDAIVRLSSNGHTGGRVTLDWTEPPTVAADTVKGTRLFELLLDHLLARGEEAGHVRVQADRGEDHWEVRLVDGSAGPEGPDPLGALFHAQSGDASLPGPLVRELCTALAGAHGTRLRAEPEEGRLAVALTLPLAHPEAAGSPERPDGNRKTL
jgi:CheY-like chemotaxis protein